MPETSFSPPHIAAARRVMTGSTAVGLVASLTIVVVAGVVAPGNAPGSWVWLRVLAIWMLVAFSLGSIIEVGAGRHVARGISPLVVWVGFLLAVLISLSFDMLTTALTMLGLVILLLTVPSTGRALAFWAAVITVVPLWVWSAFDAWDRWLLMLLPIAVAGLVSLEHAVRAGHAGGDPLETMAAWIGLLALSAVTLVVTVMGPVDPSWNTMAAVAIVLMAVLDIALSRAPSVALPPIILPAVALVTISLAWLAAL